MRRSYLPLVLLIWLASRCSHTETVTRRELPAAQADEEGGPSAARDAEQDRKKGTRGDGERRDDDGASAADAPPLATSPAGLLQPGAAAALQDGLVARGYLERSDRSGKLDGRTRGALREFQRDQGLPATGTPDDLTVHKLGLSPGDVFRSTGDDKP